MIASGSEAAAESGEPARTPSPIRGAGWAEDGAAPLSDVEVLWWLRGHDGDVPKTEAALKGIQP